MLRRLVLGLVLVVLTTPARAQVQTVQGTAASGATATGKPVQVGGVDTTGKIRPLAVGTDGTLTAGAKPLALTAGAPLIRVAISTVNANSAGIVAGNVYRIACSTDCFFRWGVGAQVAVTTDTAFFGPGTEYLTAPTGVNNIAFITAVGSGACTITTLSIP